MMKRSPLVLAALLAIPGLGCTLAPPFKSGAPSISREGVQVAVTKQRCDQVDEPDEYGWDLIEAVVEVQIGNATTVPLTVHRDVFRLLGSDGTALKTMTWRAADPLTIDPGTSGAFELRFMTRGSPECTSEMILDVDTGLVLPGGPVKVDGVKFTPTRA